MEQFKKLGLNENIVSILSKKGFETPSSIQSKIIPEFLNTKRDIIGIAKTGTGKTAAFALPLIQQMQASKNGVQALIMVPTRELALQVKNEIQSLSPRQLRVLAVYGGTSIKDQIKTLNKGVDIVVGTPGRMIDHLQRKTMKLNSVHTIVLDEADEMLSMGFLEDIENILSYATHKNKRILLLSATMPKKILNITNNYMNKPLKLEAEHKKEDHSLIDQSFYSLKGNAKFETLYELISKEDFFYGIVFCRTKADVDTVAQKLRKAKVKAFGIHGDISQNKREKILKDFKSQRVHVLVATDVASRGIHVDNVSHVVNYTLPNDTESYVHRIGRTGRKGQKGKAISFVSGREFGRVKDIERFTGVKMRAERL